MAMILPPVATKLPTDHAMLLRSSAGLTPSFSSTIAVSKSIRSTFSPTSTCFSATLSSFRSLAAMSPISTVSTDKESDQEPSRREKTLPLEPQVAKRLEKFKTTIFTRMSSLAAKHGAINLGQGFPSFDGPDFVKEAAIQAIIAGNNQYARGYGLPDLNAAVAERFQKDSGLRVDPESEVTITSGCTEAIASAILGLINPGDEVILFAPFYDCYEPVLSMAGATVKSVALSPPDFAVPLAQLASAVSSRTRAILINTPHNPTGKVFSLAELEFIAKLCRDHDLLALTDEVYHKLVFSDNEPHISIASLSGMFRRTVTMNSLGKTFSLTGWKIGWAVAPVHLTWGIRQAHAFLTFATSTPMQWAAAAALRVPESYYEGLQREYAARKRILVDGLREAGFAVLPSSGTYFVVADYSPFGFRGDDVSFCEYLVREVGVAAIPTSCFYLHPDEGRGNNFVRFAFCKDEATLRAAVRLMKERLRRIE